MISGLDKNTALVLIDFQQGLRKAAFLTPIEDILHKANELIHGFRKAGLPIVIVTVNPASARKRSTRVTAKMNLENIPAAFFELVPELDVQPEDLRVTKHTFGAFFETKLHESLQQRGVTGIVLGGIVTSIGVEGTARQASELGYNICFAEDAMSDRIAMSHENSIKNIFPRMGEVGLTEEILETLKNGTV